jgi:hypothetical protein
VLSALVTVGTSASQALRPRKAHWPQTIQTSLALFRKVKGRILAKATHFLWFAIVPKLVAFSYILSSHSSFVSLFSYFPFLLFSLS